MFYTEGGAQTIATVASGSVDIAMSNGILGAIGAYVKGGEATPYRVISAEMTGANELFWWVKADSPIKTLKDADGNTIAFSSPGSSSNLILLTLLKQMGSKAKPVPTGGVPGTYTQTMTGQIDIGWSVVPFALKDVNEGKIRIVARSREATELANQTIRANLASVSSLKTKREKLEAALCPLHFVEVRTVVGGPAPKTVAKFLRAQEKQATQDQQWHTAKTALLTAFPQWLAAETKAKLRK